MPRAGDSEAQVVLLRKPQGFCNLAAARHVYGIHRRLAYEALRRGRLRRGSATTRNVDWRAGDVVRERAADWVLRLEILVRPHLVDVVAALCVLFRPTVAGARNGCRLDELAGDAPVESVPLGLRGPAALAWDLC